MHLTACTRNEPSGSGIRARMPPLSGQKDFPWSEIRSGTVLGTSVAFAAGVFFDSLLH